MQWKYYPKWTKYKKFKFTNNITEKINIYLNPQLKRARYSTTIFRESILNLIIKFEN